MFFIKKICCIVLFILIMLSEACFGQSVKVGTVINKVISTDIKAYINGYQIKSMNIDGNTAIIVEDLRNYGFDVIWNPTDRSLTIKENLSNQINPNPIRDNNKKIGSKVADVLYTDIKTYINNKEIKSFNINGYTAIFINDLKDNGNITWDEVKREVKFTSNNLNNRQENQDNNYCFIARCIEEKTITLEEREGKYYYEGKLLSSPDNKNMVSGKMMSEILGYEMKIENGHYLFKKGNYSFKIKSNNKRIEKFFDGYLCESYEIFDNPIYLTNDVYMHYEYMSELMGLNSKGYYIDKIVLIYKEYDVQDYGYYETYGDRLFVKALSPDEGIGINIDNKTYTFNENYCKSALDKTIIPGYNKDIIYDEEYLKYSDNDIEIKLVYNGRILMLKKIKVKPDPKTNRIIYNTSIGLSMKSPQNGYTQTSESKFLIEGEITRSVGNSFSVDIEKFNANTLEKVRNQSIALTNKQFSEYLNLDKGYGLYKIKAIANIGEEKSNNKFEVFEIFVAYTK